MRIAQVAPLAEAVPPKLYGGTERVVSWLTEELVARGHEVTLFASGDSRTSAKLVPCAPQGLRLSGMQDHTASHLVMLDMLRRRSEDFDIIHFHVDLLPVVLFRNLARKCVTTLHGRLDAPDVPRVYAIFPEMPLVSISHAQRKPLPPKANWLATIHHGLGAGTCPFHPQGGDYLAFLGRVSPEKRPDRAIEIAIRAGMPLKIAAKVDKADQEYFDAAIRPLLRHPLVEFVGEIDEHEKRRFLGHARALLFPIDWPEPFGLVMVEAMSAGTPVIAWRNGSVPEVVADGISGAIVNTLGDAAAAIEMVSAIDRAQVRRHFEQHFTAVRMASEYVAAYERLLKSEHGPEPNLLAAE